MASYSFASLARSPEEANLLSVVFLLPFHRTTRRRPTRPLPYLLDVRLHSTVPISRPSPRHVSFPNPPPHPAPSTVHHVDHGVVGPSARSIYVSVSVIPQPRLAYAPRAAPAASSNRQTSARPAQLRTLVSTPTPSPPSVSYCSVPPSLPISRRFPRCRAILRIRMLDGSPSSSR